MTRALPGRGPEPLGRLVRGPFLLGCGVIALSVGGLGLWSASAPLAGAALASGQVTVETNRKTIQHLEGGIIRELLVTDGDHVKAGDVLVRLDHVKPRTSLETLHGRYYAALAREARLIAEREGAADIQFPVELLQTDHAAAADAIAGQRRIHEARRAWVDGQIAILNQQVAQLREEIAALEAQVRSETRQSELIGEEIEGVQMLVDKGLERRPRLLSLQRAAEDINGRRSEHLGLIARAQQRIGESELQIADLRNRRIDEIMRELRTVQDELFDVRERIVAARDVLERVEVRAPRDGIVVNRRFHTVGGVVAPGEALLDIVPQSEDLMIEARVRMDDIDIVRPGMKAQVRLVAYKQRWTPSVDGTVRTVSADRLQDQRTGESFFIARVEIDRASLEKLPGAELYPGMPADVMIMTAPRTALDYMLSPLTESLAKAFREQ
jgi:HlyD family type I secretion membrane fusion protein